MKIDFKKVLKNMPEKISLGSLAILLYLVDTGEGILEGISENKGTTLGQRLKRIEKRKTFGDYYEVLKNIRTNSVKTILWRLQKKGLVAKNRGLTEKGLNFIKAFRKKLAAKSVWDNKWRLVFFDIPESKRRDRIWLHNELVNNDYKPLQKSVFCGKYPLNQDLIELLIEKGLYSCIKIVTVGEINEEVDFK